MAEPLYRDCPGCGAHLPATDAPTDARYNASAECWQLNGELTVYTLTRGDRDGAFIHQLAVDAYAAQHASEHSKPFGTAFALIGLYFAFERGYTGRQVQHMHMLLARRTKEWPRFAHQGHAGALTVADVMRAEPGDERDQALRRWGRAVWDAWAPDHARVESLIASVMGKE